MTEFRDGIKRALDYAAVFGTKRLHCMAGLVPRRGRPPAPRPASTPPISPGRANSRKAAGVLVVIEPINHRDMPGFFLNTTDQAAAVVEAIGRDRLAILFDIYHCQITEGDVTSRMAKLLPLIGHVQIADVPARNEPGTGELNWAYTSSAASIRLVTKDGLDVNIARLVRRSQVWIGYGNFNK